MYVVVNVQSSDVGMNNLGVPQNSGPVTIPFLLYINDLPGRIFVNVDGSWSILSQNSNKSMGKVAVHIQYRQNWT